jgi:hypothetical protein
MALDETRLYAKSRSGFEPVFSLGAFSLDGVGGFVNVSRDGQRMGDFTGDFERAMAAAVIALAQPKMVRRANGKFTENARKTTENVRASTGFRSIARPVSMDGRTDEMKRRPRPSSGARRPPAAVRKPPAEGAG